MDNISSPPQSISNPNKSSNSWIYWLIGCCALIIIVAIGITIALGYGAFNIANNISKTNLENLSTQFENSLENDINNSLESNLQTELDKLDQDLKDLEKKTNTPNASNNEVQDQVAILEVGTIEGNLTYPSEVIPDLTICAEEISNPANQYCTKELISDTKYSSGRGYKLDVAPGKYYVYSYFSDPTYKAYYSEFVTCGMDVSCPSHAKIVVTVNDGDHLTNINPNDWYNY